LPTGWSAGNKTNIVTAKCAKHAKRNGREKAQKTQKGSPSLHPEGMRAISPGWTRHVVRGGSIRGDRSPNQFDAEGIEAPAHTKKRPNNGGLTKGNEDNEGGSNRG
jgi:hypothetical protein